jgi:hypothetical protein
MAPTNREEAMSKMLSVTTFLALAVWGGCGGAWRQVPVNVNPAAIADPVAEMKTLLNMLEYPPALTEVTDQYVKAVWPGGTGVLLFAKVADIRIITRDDIFQVSAYDAKGDEFFAYRPATHDFPTCEKFLNAFYALSKKTPPSAATAQNAVR